MAARADDSVNYKGDRYNVKIAINGSYFFSNTGTPFGGEIVGGWFLRRWGEYTGGSGFFWTLDGRAVLGGNIHNGPKWQQVRFADGTVLPIDKLNDPRQDSQPPKAGEPKRPPVDELALYTWQYAERTDAVDPGTEVVVRMSRPTFIMPEEGGVPGEIVAVKAASQGETVLLYDHVVLSGHGKSAELLKAHAKAGQQVHIDLRLNDFGNEDIGLKPAEWSGAYASIESTQYLVVNGEVPLYWEKRAAEYAARGEKHGSIVKAPRTLIAFNDRYLYFVVVDGRSSESIGMTFTDAGNFCRDHLRATYAVNQDGGGSSTMWLDGEVRNDPSGKPGVDKAHQLRPVANGYLMATVSPAPRSKALRPGNKAIAAKSFELRLGPGTQFGVAATMPADSEGKVLPHPLTGIQAKGQNWFNCRFGKMEGWGPLEALKHR